MSKKLTQIRMRRVLRARRTSVRQSTFARTIYNAVIAKLESQIIKKTYEPYLRASDSSPPEPLKHLIALGNISNLAPPCALTGLFGGKLPQVFIRRHSVRLSVAL